MANREDVIYDFATEPALPAKAVVRRWTGREALSSLYNYEVVVTTGDAAVGLRDFIGARGQLVIRTPDHTRTISGVIAKAQVLSGVAGGGSAMHTAFHFGPELAILQHRHSHRIFQDMTTEEIVTKVIEDAGIYMGRDVMWRHDQDLKKRTYCVQYRESDFAFMSRLLEDEGLFFYFAHGKGGDELVITDGKDVDDIEGEAEVPCLESGLASVGQLAEFTLETEVASNKFSHRDYDYEHPLLELEGLAEIDGEAPADATTLETYEYPGRFVEPDTGKARAKNFLGALVRNAAVGRGEGTVTRFLPGLAFSLARHRRSDLNGRYILRSVEHSGTTASFETGTSDTQVNYSCSFSCTPEALPVRPMRSTPKPRMYGAQTAMVVGPSGAEVYVDDQSRIKVQFHWDREGKADEASSCWIRVAQTWSGAGWGALTVPRIGMEVVVHFLEGDPDKPLVTGCVYNATHPPPLDSHTKSVFRTNSSPGGGGANELSFEDEKGAEEVYLHAQRDFVQVIERNVVTIIGGTRKTIVKGGSMGGGESSAAGHLGGELSSASANLQSWSQQMVANTLTEAEETRLQQLDKNLADYETDRANQSVDE
ncbi:type VI secretion system tip protein VgrG, partial [Desulfobulbus sp. AH-315-M07]|nr:type VI secretion system tip protein VgrG [Desulfobulbus sp. AH-315-M07]